MCPRCRCQRQAAWAHGPVVVTMTAMAVVTGPCTVNKKATIGCSRLNINLAGRRIDRDRLG